MAFQTIIASLYFLVLPILGVTDREVRVYKGTSRYTSDVVCSVRDAKVYRRTSTYTKDILLTVRKDRIYKGTSSYTSDILFTVDGNLTIEEFVAVWHAVRYIY